MALSAAVLLPVAGCGSDSKGKPIPRAQAALIIVRLQEAERRNDPLRCHDLQRDTIPALRDQVAALPADTDSDVKQTLSDGIDHLNDLVSQECNQQQVPTSTGPTQPSIPSTPSTTTTETTTTNTDTTNTNTNTNTNTSTDNTNTSSTPSDTTPAPGGTATPPAAGGGGGKP